MRWWTLTKSMDGLSRANVSVVHRLTVTEMAEILARHVTRYGGVILSDGSEVDAIDRFTGNMRRTDIGKAIKRWLRDFGYDRMPDSEDYSAETYAWALRQVEMIAK